MKPFLLFPIFLHLTILGMGQEINSRYDPNLANALGADDYGMKSYVLVILKTGDNIIEEKTIVDSLFMGHLKNIKRLANIGKLIVAGPLGKNENSYRGIFILDVTSFEEAHQLLATDPVIKEGILSVALYQWYGSAALPEYLKTHEKIEKKKF